jgi:flagella basal body P-ring formation protein FlgA
MKTILSLLLFAFLGTTSTFAAAERKQLIESNRIYLGDLISDLPSDIATLDLGASPKAGGSRLFLATEINRVLKSVNQNRTVNDSVRVVRSTKHWNQRDLLEFISPAISQALPAYATLVRLDVPRSVLTPTAVSVGHVEFAPFPKRRGTLSTSVVVELVVDNELEQRLSFPLVVELAEQPKPVTVPRGQNVTLSINFGLTHVSATAVTLQPTEVGSSALCRVLRTKKVLRAKMLSTSTAEVLSE